MSHKNKIITSSHDAALGTKVTYIIGFLLSLTLTSLAFLMVRIHVSHHHQTPSDGFVMVSLVILAVIQLFVQLVFFLHFGRESKPRWNAVAFAFAITVVVILVIGSLWIMASLNDRMMYSPPQINKYLNTQGDL